MTFRTSKEIKEATLKYIEKGGELQGAYIATKVSQNQKFLESKKGERNVQGTQGRN